ncbi:MAG: BNR-4 repeat-containing protein [Bacteroidota bacterium]
MRNKQINGYRGIWFALNQKYVYGDKYSGALATYTSKHRPLAVYAKEVDKTFFVYGGSTGKLNSSLFCMIGSYDHATGMVSKPVVVYDKKGVNDPHDNPTLQIDNEGYLWVFVSGRRNDRPGIKLKSLRPYDLSEFDIVSEETFTYPQIWVGDSAFLHFFIKYTGTRELYFESSADGKEWTEHKKLAGIRTEGSRLTGHYHVSDIYKGGTIAGTFFNRHINGEPDKRTDLYYIESRDQGNSWTNANNEPLDIPVTKVTSAARVTDYASQGKNVYLKDMSYDDEGNPYCLFIVSEGHQPGPENNPYEWKIAFFRDGEWTIRSVTISDHNYDMGSLYINNGRWRVVAPTEITVQPWEVGGEVVIWESRNQGRTWSRIFDVTRNSLVNHSYVRRPVNYKAPFCFFWSTGHPHERSTSQLYFGDFEGNHWKLPFNMERDFEVPEHVDSFRELELSVYPNPVAQFINLQIDQQIQSVQIYDQSGRLVLQKNNNQTGLRLNVSQLNAGFYFISVKTYRKTFHKRFIKS